MISVIILQAKYYFDVLGKEYMNLNSFFFFCFFFLSFCHDTKGPT